MAYIGNSPGVASQRVETAFTATSSQTVFTPSSGYTLGYCDVYYNGVKLVNGDDYTASDGVSITLASAAAAGDSVVVVASFPRGLTDGYLKSEADAKYVALTGDQTIAGVKTFSGSSTIVNGNLGLGVTPSAWGTGSNVKALQLNSGSLWNYLNTAVYLGHNYYFNGTNRLYSNTGPAAEYQLYNGTHAWNIAGSGSAGAVVTFNQAMTLDASGNLGLATSSPTARLTFGLQSYTASVTNAMIRFKNDQNSADGCIQSYSVGANIGTDVLIGSNFYVDTAGQFQRFNTSRESAFQVVSRTGVIYWGTGGTGATATESLQLNTNGALILKNGSTSANGVGIAFPSTQSASSDANTLDDYEEGTWTPVDTSGAGLTFGAQTSARFTKIGRCVFVDCEVSYPSNSSAVSASIGGLPFTSKAVLDYNSGTCMNDANLNIWSFVTTNTTSISLYKQAASFTGVTNQEITTRTLYISVWYLTAY